MYVTHERVQKVYQIQRAARGELYLAQNQQVMAKYKYESQRDIAIAKGEIEGKNATEREIAAKEVFSQEWEELEQSETRLTRAKHKFAQAESQVEELRLLMRVDELIAGVRPGEGH